MSYLCLRNQTQGDLREYKRQLWADQLPQQQRGGSQQHNFSSWLAEPHKEIVEESLEAVVRLQDALVVEESEIAPEAAQSIFVIQEATIVTIVNLLEALALSVQLVKLNQQQFEVLRGFEQ